MGRQMVKAVHPPFWVAQVAARQRGKQKWLEVGEGLSSSGLGWHNFGCLLPAAFVACAGRVSVVCHKCCDPCAPPPIPSTFPSLLGLFSSACNQYLARGNIPLTTSPPPLSTCLMQSALQFPSHFSHFFLITRKTHNKINRGEWKTFVLPCRKICKDFDQLNSCCCCCCSCSFWQLYDTNNCWKWLGIQMCCALLITAVLLLFI